MQTLFTIGYEQAKPAAVLGELKRAKVDLLVDTRAVAASRRPGFSKRQLAASLDEAGIAYIHLQKLGTPAEGRQAARSGDFDTLWRIYDKHIKTPEAQGALGELLALIKVGKTRLPVVLRARSERMPPQPHRRAGEKAHARESRRPDPGVVLIIPPAAARWRAAFDARDRRNTMPSAPTNIHQRDASDRPPARGRSRRCYSSSDDRRSRRPALTNSEEIAHRIDAAAPGVGGIAREHHVVDRHLTVNRRDGDGERQSSAACRWNWPPTDCRRNRAPLTTANR